MKKVTVNLSDKSEKYFNEVYYSLEGKSNGIATQSEVINYCLEALSDFEEKSGTDLIDYLKTNYPDLYAGK